MVLKLTPLSKSMHITQGYSSHHVLARTSVDPSTLSLGGRFAWTAYHVVMERN